MPPETETLYICDRKKSGECVSSARNTCYCGTPHGPYLYGLTASKYCNEKQRWCMHSNMFKKCIPI